MARDGVAEEVLHDSFIAWRWSPIKRRCQGGLFLYLFPQCYGLNVNGFALRCY